MADKLVAEEIIKKARKNVKKKKKTLRYIHEMLFNRLLCELEDEIKNISILDESCNVEITEEFNYDKEFYEGIKEVVKIFNTLFHFNASCAIDKNKHDSVIVKVSMHF